VSAAPVGPAAAGRTLPMLDGLRAVAVLAVLLTHVAFQTGQITRGTGGALLARFDAGVAVFFVLSGFLLYRPYAAGRPPATGAYALRRAARILPAYWLVLAVVALASSVPAGVVATHAWLGQTYTGPLIGSLTQTWSLCAELAFYVALPLLARAARGREAPVLGACGLGTYAYIATVHALDLDPRALLWLPGHLDWFAAGMAVAVLAERARAGTVGPAGRLVLRAAEWPGTCWAAAGVLLWLAATPVAGPLTLAPIPGPAALTKEATYAVVGLLLLVPAALGSPASGLGRVLTAPPVRWLGQVSYGVFLWHLPVLVGLYAVTGWAPFGGRMWTVALLTAVGAVGAAALSWTLVERPVLRWAHRSSRAVDQGHRDQGERGQREQLGQGRLGGPGRDDAAQQTGQRQGPGGDGGAEPDRYQREGPGQHPGRSREQHPQHGRTDARGDLPAPGPVRDARGDLPAPGPVRDGRTGPAGRWRLGTGQAR
jgi:peptidoglycan/LPS O-acetylase OafA/YrhL